MSINPKDLANVLRYKRSVAESLGLKDARPGILIAGPCIIESKPLLRTIAQGVADLGIPILRGGAFKNRTSRFSFQGKEEKALEWHTEIARRHGLKSVSEIMDGSQVPLFVKHGIDIVQIGAKSMRNYILMREVAKTGLPVVLKRDMNVSVAELLHAAEKLLYYGKGKQRMVLCERGITTVSHETVYRTVLDLNAVAWIKQHIPVPIIVDPSHAAGISSLVAPLCVAAHAMGCDGLMVEAHCNKALALCDREQAITMEELKAIDGTLSRMPRQVPSR